MKAISKLLAGGVAIAALACAAPAAAQYYPGYGNPYGYADPRYAPVGDLRFDCAVDDRGYVSNVRVDRNINNRPY